jgi:hypothetical protein
MMNSDCMVDIETMGQRWDAPVVSVGAVFFDVATGEIGQTFYMAADIDNAFRFGRANGSTVKWWMEQSDPARRSATAGTESLEKVLSEFAGFYRQNGKARVWGNGPSFDMTILEHAYWQVFAKAAPWAFWNVRDCRTMKDLGEGLYEIPKLQGTAHNALDDAIHQARWVSEIWQRLKAPKKRFVFDEDI